MPEYTIQQRTQALIRELKKIAEQANLTGKDVENLTRVLNTLGSETQFISKLAKTATVINQIAGALSNVGASEIYIEKLRTQLLGLAQDYERIGALQRQLQLVPKDLSPAQRLAAGFNIRTQFEQQQKYLAQAAKTFAPSELGGLSADQIRDQIGARATSLRLADEEQSKLLEAGVAQRLLTNETELMADLMQTRILSGYVRQKEAIQEVTRLQAEAAAKETADVERLGAIHEAFLQRYRASFGTGGALSQRIGYDTAGAQKARAESVGGRVSPDLSDQRSIGEILRTYQELIGTSNGVENLRARMESLGITNARVVSVTEELSTGVKSFSFAIERGGGAVARATIRLDRHGQVLNDVGTRYRNWTTAIQANLVKVVQWGVATGVVYGIMRGFRQTMQQIIDIENELANVQIALGQGAGDLTAVFKEAENVANLTSTSIKGVIEGYTLAYQAAGSYADETQRTTAANSLLQESMVLATLAGINQAEAMDTLVGALRQTGQELTDGRDLLDQWVAVSRESNVSLNTLASTYSIVGATAQGLGITFEQLNALTATLAEATGLSATETGNAIRGIVAGFQSAQAEKVLDRFGVETRKATGELRNFWDLLNEVSTLLASGAISPAELTEIANAIGGGYRRGAQVQTILEGMARAQQLVNVQLDAGGQAADALEIKMSTLQAAITRLGNAFTTVAETLGTEGGFLSTSKFLVETLTLFVQVINQLVGGLGKATPALLAFGAAWIAAGTGPGKGFLSGQAGTLLSSLAISRGGRELQQRLPSYTSDNYGTTGLENQLSRGQAITLARTRYSQKMGTDPVGLLLGVLPGIITAINTGITTKEGTYERTAGGVKAGAQIVGGIIGAFVGGGPAGAIIGSSIAGAFADAMTSESADVGTRIAEYFLLRTQEEKDKGGVGEDRTASIISEDLMQGLNPLVRILAGGGALTGRAAEFLGRSRGSAAFQSPETTVQSEDVLIGLIQGKVGARWVQNLITDEDRQLLSDLIAQSISEGIEKGDIAGPFRTLVESGIPDIETAADDVVAGFLDEARRQFVLGQINVTDMIDLSDLSPETIAPAISQLREALSLAGVDISVNDLVSSYLDLDNAAKQLLDTASRQVITAADLVDYYKNSEEGLDKLAGATDQYNTTLTNLAELQKVIAQRQILGRVQERPIVQLGRLDQGQIQAVRREAERIRNETADAYANGNQEGAKLWIEQLGNVLIQTGEGIGREFWGEFFNQDPEFISQAIENLGLEDAIKDATTFGLQDLRDQLGVSDFAGLMRRYEQVKSTITSVFPQYQLQEEPTGLILKDGFRTIHADQTLLNLAMQDLIDVNEQQLEGVWNIPQGMTAFVAWSSLFSRNVPSGGTTTAWPFNVQEGANAPGTTTGAATGTPRSTQPIQDEVVRLAALINDIQARITAPGADQATVEQGRFYQDELSNRITQLLDEQNKIIESRGKTAVTLGGEPVGGTPVDQQTSVLDQIKDVFQLENKITISANIRLLVDGRTLANVVKDYLYEDLVNAVGRTIGTGGGGYVIEGH